MKKLVFLIVANILIQNISYSQIEFDNLSINVYQPSINGIPIQATNILDSKLKEIVTMYGISDYRNSERFIITAKLNIISKDNIVGPPQQLSQKFNVYIIIGDVLENKIYGSISLPIIGIGNDETQSFIKGINSIKPQNENIKKFITESKGKISNYYNSICESIFLEANTLNANQKFDEAIYKLSEIPAICTKCFEQSQKSIINIYQNKINFEGGNLLKEAKIIWAKSQDSLSAHLALNLVTQINLNANCQDSLTLFINTVSTKLKQYKQEKFDLQIKQREEALKQNQKLAEQEYELTKLQLKSAKEIAIEFAKNQPKVIERYKIVTSW